MYFDEEIPIGAGGIIEEEVSVITEDGTMELIIHAGTVVSSLDDATSIQNNKIK